MEIAGEEQIMTPRKKCKLVVCETQTTPRKSDQVRVIEANNGTDSPETKRLKGMIVDLNRMDEMRREEKVTRSQAQVIINSSQQHIDVN